MRFYKVLTKINQGYCDHSHQFRMHYFTACMQNILIFLVNLRAQCSIFWPFIQNLCNNHQITKKNLTNLDG